MNFQRDPQPRASPPASNYRLFGLRRAAGSAGQPASPSNPRRAPTQHRPRLRAPRSSCPGKLTAGGLASTTTSSTRTWSSPPPACATTCSAAASWSRSSSPSTTSSNERQFRFSIELANIGSIGNFMGQEAARQPRLPGRTMTTRILVTGGAGFIGSNFVRHVARTQPGLGDRGPGQAHLRRPPREPGRRRGRTPASPSCRATSRTRRWWRRVLPGCHYVVNFAAETHVDRSLYDAGGFIQTDVYGAFVLLEEARRSQALQLFVQISTDEVYGSVEKGSSRETDALMPRNPYSASKAGGGPAGLLVLRDLRRARDRDPRLQQLRALPVPGEGHPALRDPRHRRHPGAALRRRPQRARLAARGRPLPGRGLAARARACPARPTTSAAATRSRTSSSPGASCPCSGKPESLIQPRAPTAPATTAATASTAAKLRALGWAPQVPFAEGLRAHGRVVPRARGVVASAQGSEPGLPRALPAPLRRADDWTRPGEGPRHRRRRLRGRPPAGASCAARAPDGRGLRAGAPARGTRPAARPGSSRCWRRTSRTRAATRARARPRPRPTASSTWPASPASHRSWIDPGGHPAHERPWAC